MMPINKAALTGYWPQQNGGCWTVQSNLSAGERQQNR